VTSSNTSFAAAGHGAPPSEQELKGTMVLAVPLVEASAKVRTGFAVDEEEDYASPHGPASSHEVDGAITRTRSSRQPEESDSTEFTELFAPAIGECAESCRSQRVPNLL